MSWTLQSLHKNFVINRIENANLPISETIHRKNLLPFKNRPAHKKKNSKIGIHKNNAALLTQLSSSLQYKPYPDIAEFFKFENQREPPALSDNGMLRSGQKSVIISCVGAPTSRSIAAHVSMRVTDGPAVIHISGALKLSVGVFPAYIWDKVFLFVWVVGWIYVKNTSLTEKYSVTKFLKITRVPYKTTFNLTSKDGSLQFQS